MRTEYHLSTSHWQSLSHCNTTIVVVVIVVAGASCCGNLLWLSPSCTDAGHSGWCVPAVASWEEGPVQTSAWLLGSWWPPLASPCCSAARCPPPLLLIVRSFPLYDFFIWIKIDIMTLELHSNGL